MTFALGAQGALVLQVEYLDPATFDTRLEGAQVWPVRVSVRNDSQQTQSFSALDLRLSVGGGEGLTPVSPVEIADEILTRRTKSTIDVSSGTEHRIPAHRDQRNILAARLGDGTLAPHQHIRESCCSGGHRVRQPPTSTVCCNSMSRDMSRNCWRRARSTSRRRARSKRFGRASPSCGTATRLGGRFHSTRATRLVIGVGRYRYLPSLSSPEKDVKKMTDFLRAQGFDEVLG